MLNDEASIMDTLDLDAAAFEPELVPDEAAARSAAGEV